MKEEGKCCGDDRSLWKTRADVKSSRACENFTDSAREKKKAMMNEKFWKKSINPLYLCFENAENEKKFQKMHKEKGRKVLRIWSVLLNLLTCIVYFQTKPNAYMSEFLWTICNMTLALANSCFFISVNSKIWELVNIEVRFSYFFIY
jgi:hypothetical protein